MNPNGDIVPIEEAEPGALPIEYTPYAASLREMPRRARLAFLSVRRGGGSEADAYEAAKAAQRRRG